MSPLNAHQLSDIRDERREQIKAAALKVFARHGIAGAKMSKIASEAKVSHGLFYRYFASKEALYTALVDELMQAASTAIAQLANLPGTPTQQLQAFTESMLAPENRHAFMLIEKARADDDAPEPVKRILSAHSPQAIIEGLVPIFAKGQRAGQFIKGDARQLLSWYFLTLNSLILGQRHGAFGLPSATYLLRLLRQ